jgi:hypothetical protein
MYCPRCGEPKNHSAHFCRRCGLNLVPYAALLRESETADLSGSAADHIAAHEATSGEFEPINESEVRAEEIRSIRRLRPEDPDR